MTEEGLFDMGELHVLLRVITISRVTGKSVFDHPATFDPISQDFFPFYHFYNNIVAVFAVFQYFLDFIHWSVLVGKKERVILFGI